MKKINISFVASTFTVGGSERVMSDLITRLPDSKFNKRVYFLRNAGTIGRGLLDGGIKGAERLQNSRYDAAVVWRLVRLFRADPPDVLFLLDHHNAMLYGRTAALIARVPRQVIASHSTGRFGGKKNFRTADRWLMEFTDRVVALSGSHAQYLVDNEAIEAGKITVIENGIDVAEYGRTDAAAEARLRQDLGLAASDRVITMVAAMRPEKAHETLLEAAQSLVVSYSGLKFLLVGDGALRGQIEASIARRGLENHVLILGVRSDVARLLHISDALVLPSFPVVETLPMSVLEAMAAGLPVVASRVGSIPDVIEHGQNGLLIEPADPGELVSALSRLLDDKEVGARLSGRARETVRGRFTVEAMVDGYARLFEDLVYDRPGR